MTIWSKKPRLAAAVAALIAAAGALAAEAKEPTAHRAIYEGVGGVGDLAQIQALIEARTLASCDEWLLDYNTGVRISAHGEKIGSAISQVKIREAKDGSALDFDVLGYAEEAPQSRVRVTGKAVREGSEAEAPKGGALIRIPDDVLFPNAANIAISEAAARGEKRLRFSMFDPRFLDEGGKTGGILDALLEIRPAELTPEEEENFGRYAPEGAPLWRISTKLWLASAGDGAAVYESEDVIAGGGVFLDTQPVMGGMKLNVALRSLDWLENEPCAGAAP